LTEGQADVKAFVRSQTFG